MTADLDSAPQNCTPRQLASRCVNVRNQEPRQGAPPWIATVAVFDFPRRSESLRSVRNLQKQGQKVYPDTSAKTDENHLLADVGSPQSWSTGWKGSMRLEKGQERRQCRVVRQGENLQLHGTHKTGIAMTFEGAMFRWRISGSAFLQPAPVCSRKSRVYLRTNMR